MNSKPMSSYSSLIERWKGEHQALDQFVSEMMSWMHDVSAHGDPRFGEAGSRLTQLRERLAEHFRIEGEIATELCESRPSSLETQAAKRQALRDHELLMARIDDLSERLMRLESPFGSWQEAVEQIGLFIDALEQHEEQESENIQWLSP